MQTQSEVSSIQSVDTEVLKMALQPDLRSSGTISDEIMQNSDDVSVRQHEKETEHSSAEQILPSSDKSDSTAKRKYESVSN